MKGRISIISAPTFLAHHPVGKAIRYGTYRGMRVAAVDGFVPDASGDGRRSPCAGAASTPASGVPAGQGRDLDGDRGARPDRCGCRRLLHGEPELAIELVDSAAGMLVILDRGAAGGGTMTGLRRGWRAPARPGAFGCGGPDDSAPAGRARPRPDEPGRAEGRGSRATSTAVEYQVDGGEVIRLLTDLLDVGGARRQGPRRHHGRDIALPGHLDEAATASKAFTPFTCLGALSRTGAKRDTSDEGWTRRRGCPDPVRPERITLIATRGRRSRRG